MVYFLSTPFIPTCHFFHHFSFDTQQNFFEENEYDIHFFNFSFFLFKIKYHPISRKRQNEKPFFVFLSKIQNTFFWQVRKNFLNPNDVIKFINTKIGKPFFQFFLQKPQHTCICFIINQQKKYENRGVPSRVLNSGNSAKGMILPKAGSLALYMHGSGFISAKRCSNRSSLTSLMD